MYKTRQKAYVHRHTLECSVFRPCCSLQDQYWQSAGTDKASGGLGSLGCTGGKNGMAVHHHTHHHTQVEGLQYTPCQPHNLTMTVFEFPPSESCRRRVSLEVRYGTCLFPSTRAEMTLPRVIRERFIFAASFSRIPSAPVLDWRSEP